MSDALLTTLLILGPTYLCCAIALIWSTYSASQRLARILRLSSFTCAIILTLAFIALAIPPLLCDGNALYGYGGCSGISEALAQNLTAVAVFCFAIGIGYGAVLLVGGGIWEVAARTRKS